MKIIKSKKGAVLLQVLLIGIVIAGLAAVLLNLSLSRTSSMIRIKHKVSAKKYLEACMAEKQAEWIALDIEPASILYTCSFVDDGRTVTVNVKVASILTKDYKRVEYKIARSEL